MKNAFCRRLRQHRMHLAKRFLGAFSRLHRGVELFHRVAKVRARNAVAGCSPHVLTVPFFCRFNVSHSSPFLLKNSCAGRECPVEPLPLRA